MILPWNPQILTDLPWVRKPLLFQDFCRIILLPLTPNSVSWTFFLLWQTTMSCWQTEMTKFSLLIILRHLYLRISASHSKSSSTVWEKLHLFKTNTVCCCCCFKCWLMFCFHLCSSIAVNQQCHSLFLRILSQWIFFPLLNKIRHYFSLDACKHQIPGTDKSLMLLKKKAKLWYQRFAWKIEEYHNQFRFFFPQTVAFYLNTLSNQLNKGL